jgi:hypothetical protein
MLVPETEQNAETVCHRKSSFRTPNQRKGQCAHCGDPLTLFQRIAGAEFCSSDHAASYRRMRTRKLVSLLDQASHPVVPSRRETMLSAVTVAGAAASPRLWSGSGKWTRSPLTALAKAREIPPRRFMDRFSGEELVAVADVTAVHRPPELQLAANTPANLPVCTLLPAPVGMHCLHHERRAA